VFDSHWKVYPDKGLLLFEALPMLYFFSEALAHIVESEESANWVYINATT
jgi:hypothetical protein